MVNLTICLLIIIGGLGFAVLQDVKQNRGNFKKFRLHSKLVVAFTGILLLGGTLIVLLVEWSNPNTLGPMNFFQKLQAAFFQSVTLRTAGFNTIDQASLLPATKMISVILMFIGASPASTGGRRQDLDDGGALPQRAHGGARPLGDRRFPPHHQPRYHAARAGHRHDRPVCAPWRDLRSDAA